MVFAAWTWHFSTYLSYLPNDPTACACYHRGGSALFPSGDGAPRTFRQPGHPTDPARLDNITPPVAACLGDLLTLFILALLGTALVGAMDTPIPLLAVIIMSLAAGWFTRRVMRNEWVKNVAKGGWVPLVSCTTPTFGGQASGVGSLESGVGSRESGLWTLESGVSRTRTED